MISANSPAKTVVVTGGSRGIGAAVVEALIRAGMNVVCLSRSGGAPELPGDLSKAAAERLLALACDVTDEGAFASALQQAVSRFDGIDALVNNAGIHESYKSSEMSRADFERVISVNATSVFAACRDAFPYLREKGGTIVNIGSFFERIGAKGSTAYCASKAAVGAITRCLAAEWGRHGISVVNVAPGYIETDINKEYLSSAEGRAQVSGRSFLNRPGTVEEIAALVETLVSGRIPFLTGETIFVDGGHGISL